MATSQARATWFLVRDRLDRVLHKGPICSGVFILVVVVLPIKLNANRTGRVRSLQGFPLISVVSTIEGAETSPGPSSSRRGPAIGPPHPHPPLSLFTSFSALSPHSAKQCSCGDSVFFCVCVSRAFVQSGHWGGLERHRPMRHPAVGCI